MANIDKLYNAIAGAEHQGYLGTEGYDPWIRTKHAPEKGSDAFGPVQLLSSTMGLMPMTAEGNPMINYSDEEKAFIEKYQQQGQEFYKHGKNKDKIEEGYEYDPRFDYGGKGEGFSEEDKGLYESVAKKLIGYEYDRTGGEKNMDKFIQSWRGKSYEEDPEYYDFIKEQTMMDKVASEQGSEAF